MKASTKPENTYEITITEIGQGAAKDCDLWEEDRDEISLQQTQFSN